MAPTRKPTRRSRQKKPVAELIRLADHRPPAEPKFSFADFAEVEAALTNLYRDQGLAFDGASIAADALQILDAINDGCVKTGQFGLDLATAILTWIIKHAVVGAVMERHHPHRVKLVLKQRLATSRERVK